MVAAVVPPVVGGLLGAVSSNVAAVVIKLIGNGYDLWSDFDNDIEYVRSNLRMIAGAEEDQLSGNGNLSIVMTISMEEMHDLAFEIEDFLDQIQRFVVERNSGPLHEVLGFASKLVLENNVRKLKERLKNAYSLKRDHNLNGPQPSASWMPPPNTYLTKIGPVGIDEHKKDICDWVITKDVEGEQLSVISIVGFSGSGKSTLAKAVYDCDDVIKQFPHRAWVLVSKHGGNTKELLAELLEKLGQRGHSNSGDVEQLQAKISKYLEKNKRYLIVLDDIKNQTWWEGIKSAFPENATGRIIVTTTIQTVARVCSCRNGYVHNMAALDCKHSRELMKAVLKRPTPGLERSSPLSVVNKCDGHPHALVTMANYLQGEDVISDRVCKQLCQNLGFRMATEDALEELRTVLMNNYRSLPKQFLNLKACLLYLCVFPDDCNIRRSRLMRRWLAEGYVQNDYPRGALVVADDNFKKLVDLSFINPIDTSSSGNVKTCRAHAILHEFLLHISTRAKFITSLDNEERRNYRHLFIQNTSRCASDDQEKLRAHSLTICGSACEAVGYFAKCQLLRVLDMEECKDLEDKHLDGINELWYLKYLSVGGTISRLPKDIEKLHCLETLDMRKSKKEIILPVGVINLPHLAHLLGKFKLEKSECERSKEYMPEKCKLQTLAGFVTGSDNNSGFPKLMLYMNQLRKVKIWLNLTDEGTIDLKGAIERFVQADLGIGVSVRSLSLDIGNHSPEILNSLVDGFLMSLTLHGKLSGQVHFATMLDIKELCLSSTNDLAEYDLPQLRKLKDLEYLKLVTVSLGNLVIESGDFISLLRLCLVQCPSLPTIKEGALPNLHSLQLLNQGLDGLSGIVINWHKSLREVALDSEIKPKTREDWKDAAKKHPKRPNVCFFKRVDPEEPGSMVKYVATDSTTIGTETNDDAGQQDSSVGILSEISTVSTELPTATDDGMYIPQMEIHKVDMEFCVNGSNTCGPVIVPAETDLCYQ